MARPVCIPTSVAPRRSSRALGCNTMLSPDEQKVWIETEWEKIYRVVSPPPPERVWHAAQAYPVTAGDYGWSVPVMSPPERVGQFITLEGWDDRYRLVWLADFLPSEVEYAAQKPDLTK